MIKALWILLICIGSSQSVRADDIEFPEEELARETTLPVFEKRRVVLNRNILTDHRLEFGVGPGLEMNEPYYSDLMGQVMGTYNFNDTSAVNVQGLFWTGGLSSYGEQLKVGTNVPKRPPFDASKAPHPTWGTFVNYEFIAYYGKISITKQGVMNLNLFGIAGLGYINMNPLSTIGLNLGLGQNFFLTNHLALRTDLRWIIFQGPNAATKSLQPADKPSAGSFDTRTFYNSQVGLSLVYVL